MAMKRRATAVWSGTLKAGTGKISTQSTALNDLPYDFRMRFEDQPGTNPEELIGAAHAGCFSMALSGELEKAGMVAEEITTQATVTMEPVNGAPTVTAIHLDLTARIPEADEAAFQKAASDAKANCPISRLLQAASITLTAQLA